MGVRSAAALAIAAIAAAASASPTPASAAGDTPAPQAPPPAPVLTRAPELLEEALPAYPADIQQAGVAGEVVVRLLLDEGGVVRRAELVGTLHPVLDAAALDAAAKLRFRPAEVDGRPAAVSIDYHFVFRPPPTVAPEAGATGPAPPAAAAGPDDGPDDRPDDRPTPPRDETVVRARRPWTEVDRAPLTPDPSPVTGRWELTRRDLELTAGAMGDVAKVVGQLPGVAADPDMFALFFVRGGDADETAFFLDGVQLLNPNHLGGTFTVFNPKLVDSVSLYAAAPPAPYGDGLAGALDVRYVDGDTRDWDGILDFNMAMGAAHVSGPLGKPGSPARFLVSARRSWFEPYLAVVRATGLFGDTRIGMAFGEYLGRVTVEPRGPGSAHRLQVTALHGHDTLSITGEPGDDAVVRIERGLTTRNRLSLLSMDWRWRFAPRAAWTWLLYYTHDYEERLQEAAFDVTRVVWTARPGLRGELEVGLPVPAKPESENRLRIGVDLAAFSVGGDGTIKDPRAVPTWAALPWADLGAGALRFDSTRAWTELAAWIEDDWTRVAGLPLNLRAGLRATLMGPTDELLLSPRLGVAVPLPTATTFKGALGLYYQPPRDPLLLDPSVGAPDPRAARAFHVSAGIEQGLPIGGLVRAEFWHKALDRLMVNPDSAAAVARGAGFASVGTGTATGVDLFLGLRGERGGAGLIGSVSRALRSNPLNEAGPQTFAPAWDQRASLRLLGEVRIGKLRRWTLGGMWEIRSGRPRTPVAPLLASDGSWYVRPYSYNSRDYGPWTELSLRLEYVRIKPGAPKQVLYLDLLNATMARSEFVWIYGRGTVGEDGEPLPPRPYVFRQLPIRPWIGTRLEF